MKRATILLVLVAAFILPLKAADLHKYGQAVTVYFPLFDVLGEDLETAASCAGGDVKISKNGGAFASTNSCFVSETNGIYSLALLETEMQAATVAIVVIDQTATKVWLDHAMIIDTYGDSSAKHAVDLDSEGFRQSQSVIVTGAVTDATFSPTTTAFETDITEATADHYNGRVIIFTSGALQYQALRINDYALTNSKGRFTVSTATEAPADGDTFIIL